MINSVRVWLAGGLTGLGTGLTFILVHDLFTTDRMFSLWEFGVTLCAPALVGICVALISRTNGVILLAVAYLTLLMPVLGAAFGASGTEPLWIYASLGLIGGLVWSTPFATWKFISSRIKRGTSTKD